MPLTLPGCRPKPAWSKLQISLFSLKKDKGAWGIAPAGSGQRPSAIAEKKVATVPSSFGCRSEGGCLFVHEYFGMVF
jgi:hypothetical protein